MLRSDHVLELEHLSLFRSRRERPNVARAIREGCEELEFITAGRGIFDAEGGEIALGRGAVLWHLPGEYTIHRFDPADPYECVVVRFRVSGAPVRQVPRVSVWRDTAQASAFALELLQSFHGGGYDARFFALYAYTRFLFQAHGATLHRTDPSLPDPIRRALSFLEDHLAKPIAVSDLARAAGYSTAHLHAVFREHLGQTPHQTLLARRIDRARHLLATTDLLARDVGIRSGFADPVTFARAFRREVGQTPIEYRRAHAPPVA